MGFWLSDYALTPQRSLALVPCYSQVLPVPGLRPQRDHSSWFLCSSLSYVLPTGLLASLARPAFLPAPCCPSHPGSS